MSATEFETLSPELKKLQLDMLEGHWCIIAYNPWYITLRNHTTGELKQERYRD